MTITKRKLFAFRDLCLEGECVRCGAPEGYKVYRRKSDHLYWEIANLTEPAPRLVPTKPDHMIDWVRLQNGLCNSCSKRKDAFIGVSGAFALTKDKPDPNRGTVIGKVGDWYKVEHEHKHIRSRYDRLEDEDRED